MKKTKTLYSLLKEAKPLLRGIVYEVEESDYCHKGDLWHEFYNLDCKYEITIEVENDGFHINDGDTSCCVEGSFDKTYPFDVKVSTIVRKIKHELLVNQPAIMKKHDDAKKKRADKFGRILEEVRETMPCTIALERIDDYVWADFSKKKQVVRISLEGEFDDIWVRGLGKLKTRERRVKSEYDSREIAKVIKKALA